MKMYIELYASLMPLLPPGKERFRREIKVEDGTNVQQLIELYKITDELAHIVLVNGHFVCSVDDRKSRELVAEDTVSIWPPVAGG
ncbi:MAG: MoaD/ThiS family protein [Gammaproteobacteria bacterium]|jgi:molybdopterin converting factor small subunit|nr:MoaD/ThiS family protein [Gammaproteobacteria bacterium]MBT3725956.1 MoaD/ThiS family protein [Gammaproteobacteria bacterium]MBT4077201.1 MoaD/ThiS family protein [Gammaproteobacteria bacterium]MBT4193128.1 MoaD/ThiS family protein [Gammaproteobacteria bacterium]MBT4450263.1 MoaD/ThiS family protein [Gammaproteobacteria bacterium]